MALTTYDGLVVAVQSWLHRSDITASMVADFITSAEARLRRVVRVPQMLTQVDVTLAADYTTALPSDWLAPYSLVLDQPLARVSVADYTKALDATGAAKADRYTIVGGQIAVAPRVGATTGQLTYYAAPPYLSSTQQTNLWTSIAPDLLFYLALSAARVFVEDPPWAQLVEQKATELLKELQAQALRDEMADDVVVDLRAGGFLP